MPRTWKEGFDFYLVQFEEGPASVLLDLNAATSAPLSSHPQRLIIRAKMKQPADNGLRSAEEAQALFDLEDAITAALRRFDGIFVGRLVTAGITDLFFYLPSHAGKDAVVAAVHAAGSTYALSTTLEADEEWSMYFEVLYPEQRDLQSILNRRVCEKLKQSGDHHQVPRQVDHGALFPDEHTARNVGQELVAAGFEVDPPRPPQPGSDHQMWFMAFHRVDSVTEARIDAIVYEVLDILEGSGGHYDGWGCTVVRASA